MTISRHRLRDASAFDAVFKGNAYRISSNAFLFLAMRNDVDHGRMGMVIGKKNIKLASRRNRVKRVLREAFRHYFCDESIDLVVVARGGVSVNDQCQLNEQVHHLMEKLKLKIRS